MSESHGTVRLVAGLTAGVLLLAVVVGNAVATLAAERTGAAAPVDAVVVGDAGGPGRSGEAAAPAGAGSARVAWSDSLTTARVATVPVPAGTRAGDVRRVWVAPDGTVVPRPDPGSAPWVASLLTAVLGGAAGAAVVGGHRASRRRAYDRDLAAEWARVEPLWTGRTV